MHKSPDAFRSIGEVAQLVGVAPHVLRYWEAQFDELSPLKRADGRRYYRLDDVHLAAGLCQVLREDGLTIRGAKRLIAADRGEGLRARGAERLSAVLGCHKGSVKAKRAASPVGDQAAGDAAQHRDQPAAADHRRHSPSQARSGENPSLFAELTQDQAAARPWLARLTTTANHLRSRTDPLPAGARALAQALNAAGADL